MSERRFKFVSPGVFIREIDNSQIIEIINLLKHDKKTLEGKINFVLLNGISNTEIDVLVDKSLINDAFKYYNNLSWVSTCINISKYTHN